MKKLAIIKNKKPHKSFLKCGYTSKKSKIINFSKNKLFNLFLKYSK